MPRINKKRTALVEALGEGARVWGDGEATGILYFIPPNGSPIAVNVQVDGEHDGSFAVSQVGGILDAEMALSRSSRGPRAAREKLLGKRGTNHADR
jgi:hypothetical protein